MIYLDSNVFIYPVIYDPTAVAKASRACNLLLKLAKGEIEACTCTLTWDEVVWVTRRFFGVEKARAQGSSLLKLPNLKFVPVDYEVVSKAQEILEVTNLKPRDSIHAAAALRNRIKDILSDDTGYDNVKGLERIPL